MSLIEVIRSGGITVPFGTSDYSINVYPTEVVVNGCDCASVPTDEEVKLIHEALGAYLRIVKNRGK